MNDLENNKDLDFRAKKKFGQNLLVNKNIKHKIFEKVKQFLESDSSFQKLDLLEIGPGKGDLTKYFLKLQDPDRKLVAVEIDKDAVDFLRDSFEIQNKTNFNLIHGDAVELLKDFDFIQTKFPNGFALLANLPFNVGSRILVDVGIYSPSSPMAVILQKEVVEKTTKLSAYFQFFGAWLNLFWDLKKEFHIPPSAFKPSPDVTSALLIAKPKKQLPEFLDSSQKREKAKNVLKNLFKFPKKTLANNLKNLEMSKSDIQKFLQENSLDNKTRLNTENYAQILEQLIK